MNKKNLEIKIFIIILLLLLCTFIFVYLLKSVPIYGYEPSFYLNIPIWYFLILMISFFFFTILLLYVYYSDINGEIPVLFMIVAFVLTFVILSQWMIKHGSPYGIGDIYAHLGYVKQIYETGYLPDRDIYPITHILLFFINLFTNINSYIVITWMEPLLSPLFIALSYCIGKELFNKKIGYISVLFAVLSPFIMDVGGVGVLVPFILSFFILPMQFFILIKIFKNKKSQYKVLLLIISTAMIFIHLQAAILFFSALLFFLILQALAKRFINKFSLEHTREILKYTEDTTKIKNYLLMLMFIIFVLMLIWIFWLDSYAKNIFISILKTISKTISISHSRKSVQQTSITIRPFWYFVVRRINIIVTTFLTTCVTIFGLKVALKNLKRGKLKNISPNLFVAVYFGICAVSYFMSTALFSHEFGISGRYIWAASLVYPPIIGYGFYKLISKMSLSNRRELIILSIIIFILCAFFFTSIMEKYPRTEQGYYSFYTTDNVFMGMKWGYTHMNHSNSKIMGGGDQFNALALYMFGRENYEMFRGSTNGFLEFLGYSPADYRHRGTNEHYIPGHKSQFIYYEPLMAYYLANPKYAKSIVTVQQTELDTREDLQKIYDSKDFSTYNLRS